MPIRTVSSQERCTWLSQEWKLLPQIKVPQSSMDTAWIRFEYYNWLPRWVARYPASCWWGANQRIWVATTAISGCLHRSKLEWIKRCKRSNHCWNDFCRATGARNRVEKSRQENTNGKRAG